MTKGVIRRLSYSLEGFALAAAGAASLVVTIMMTAGMIARSAGYSLFYADEYSGYLMAAIVFLALPAVTRDREHLRADFFILLLGPTARTWLQLLADLALSIYAIILFAIAVRLFSVSFEQDVRSQGLLSTPLFVPQAVMVVGLLLLTFRGCYHVVLGFLAVHRGRRTHDEPNLQKEIDS